MISEDKLQMQLVAFFYDLEESHGGFTFFSVPNEGYRSNGERYKKMGLRAGVHDLIFLIDGGKTVLIELKIEGEHPSEKQIIWHRLVTKLGFRSAWFSSNDCKIIISEILRELVAEGFHYAAKDVTMDQLAEKWVDGFPI